MTATPRLQELNSRKADYGSSFTAADVHSSPRETIPTAGAESDDISERSEYSEPFSGVAADPDPAAEILSPFEKIASWVDAVTEYWASSLRIRVASIILVGGLLITALAGILITKQLSASIFHQATTSYIQEFSADANTAQSNFLAAAVSASGQTQQVANNLVSKMYDRNRGMLGALLVRSPGQPANTNQIVEPATAPAAKIHPLISDELKRAVVESKDIAWQSVKIMQPDIGNVPGVLMGTSIYIPNSGQYEFYAIFSLETQQKLLQTTQRVLAVAVVVFGMLIALLTYAILRLVLRPVREASQNARQLAEGEFTARMEVSGSDELAQLAKSFNLMAASLEDQFAKLERMSALQTNFVSAVSHELRSPVTTMRMAGQLIYDKRDELPPILKRSAELQHDQVINLETMLTDLLEISRYDAGAMALATEETDLAEIVRNIVAILDPLAVDNGVIVRTAASGNTIAEADPRRIERIVRNLVVNALEHSDGNPVHVNVVGNETAVGIEVRDAGIGLSDEQAAHVFDRFWRADSSRVRKTGGTGLGLTIAREDALIHGGSLEAAGELGVGAVFLLTVPKTPAATYIKPIQLVKPIPVTGSEISDLPEISDVPDIGDSRIPESAAAAALQLSDERNAKQKISCVTRKQSNPRTIKRKLRKRKLSIKAPKISVMNKSKLS
ncbi:MtrAB system histidine kinase MtrB [Arcanobacterium hippocoleae]